MADRDARGQQRPDLFAASFHWLLRSLFLTIKRKDIEKDLIHIVNIMITTMITTSQGVFYDTRKEMARQTTGKGKMPNLREENESGIPM